MKAILRMLLLLPLVVVVGCPKNAVKSEQAEKSTAAAPEISSVAEIEKRTPPLPPFQPQQPVRIQLDNGMVIFLQEDHELPFINGTARIRGGSREMPGAKAGMAGILGQAWRTGGTASQTGDQMDDFLEARAAAVETGSQLQSTTINFSALKEDFNDVFKLFVDLLQHPEFRQDKVDLAKNQSKTGISRRNEDPSAIAAREAAKLVYGVDSPYARQSEYWTVDAVTRQDLLDFHKRFVHPNNIILGVVGDFDPKQMEAQLRQVFGSWQKGEQFKRADETFKPPAPGVYLIEKEDVNQSNIRMVTLGTRRDNPDFYTITVMNEALGGGFSARLFSNIRSKQGLAYSVGGGVGVNFDYPGILQLVMGTKSEQTAKAVKALQNELAQLKTHPFTQVEIDKAKANILNSWIFNFDSKEAVLAEKMLYEFYGYPLDTLEHFRQGVEKTTLADVNRAVEKYIEGKQFAIVVVGKSADFDQPLSTFGNVQNIDVTIPTEPPTATGKPMASALKESSPEGKALMAKVLGAMGGADKLQTLKAISFHSQSTRVTPQGELQIESNDVRVFPDKARAELSTPMGQMTMVVTPEVAYMGPAGQTQDFPAAMRSEALKDLRRDLLSLVTQAPTADFSYAVDAADGGLSILDVGTESGNVRLFIDNAGLVQRAVYKTTTMQGPAEREITFSDYKNVDGLMLPTSRQVKENGNVVSKATYSDVKLNPPVDAKAFTK